MILMIRKYGLNLVQVMSITILCLSPISCIESEGLLSNNVIIYMYEERPYLNYKGENNVVCRKGQPDDYLTPWDEARLREGEPPRTVAEDTTDDGGDEPRSDVTYLSGGVEDYWFWFAPFVHNRTPWHLVIDELRIRVFQGQDEVGSANFMEGYCATVPLYYFEPNESITKNNLNRTYDKGNIKFFVGGLTPIEPQASSGAIFPTIRVPEYRVEWQMIGFFANSNGEQQGIFQKTGNFLLRPPRS